MTVRPAMRAARARVTDCLRAAGLDAVVSWQPTTVRYLTGYWCWLAPLFVESMVSPGGSSDLVQRNVAVVAADGRAGLVLEPLWALNAVELDADVRLAGQGQFTPPGQERPAPGALRDVVARVQADDLAADPFDALAALLAEWGIADGRLGVELDGAAPRAQAALRARLPRAELLDCTSLLQVVRAAKDPAQVAALAQAADIAERAAGAVLGEAEPGATAGQLADAFRARIGAEGADFDHFALGPAGAGFLTGGRQPLCSAEAMYVDFGVIHRGWFSDSGTTFCLAPPSPRARDQHAVACESVAAGAAAAAPGVRSSTVHAAMTEVFTRHGVAGAHPHGHGLGLSVREYPLLMPDAGGRLRDACIDVSADLPLEEGMVFNLEAPILVAGVRSVHCERTFVVTETGCRPLIEQARDAPVAAAPASRPRQGEPHGV